MDKLTPYDVLIGILMHFPNGKTSFRANSYGYREFIDFLEEESGNYSVLRGFTRGDLEDGLDVLTTGGMIQWSTATPKVKEFNPEAIKHAYDRFKKRELLGEKGVEEVKDLSRKFVERFG